MYKLKKLNRIDDKITLTSVKFSMNKYKKIKIKLYQIYLTQQLISYNKWILKKNTNSMMKL